MKSRLLIPGILISISFLTFSCTNDDYEIPTNNSSQLKTVAKHQLQDLHAKAEDSISNTTIPTVNTLTDDGDPIIPRPPRKD